MPFPTRNLMLTRNKNAASSSPAPASPSPSPSPDLPDIYVGGNKPDRFPSSPRRKARGTPLDMDWSDIGREKSFGDDRDPLRTT